MRTWALDVHEVRVWRLHQTLELVAAGLRGGSGVEEIDGESLHEFRASTCPRGDDKGQN